MAKLLIVHGGWGGGWEWTGVARKLRQLGHDVFTPTLTGLGERAHLALDSGLSTHVQDILAVLECEDLREVVLCGHSYAGMVVTAVADRSPGRIRQLIYLDAFVPQDGQSLAALLPAEFRDALVSAAQARGDGRVPIPDELLPPEGVLPDAARAYYVERLRPHPIATMTDSVSLSGAVDGMPRAYVHCTGPADDVIKTFAARAKAAGWPYRELATAHDLHVLDPEGTVAVLDELARI